MQVRPLHTFMLMSADGCQRIEFPPVGVSNTHDDKFMATDEEAKAIAEHYARSRPGKKFHLLKVMGTVVAAESPVTWTDAVDPTRRPLPLWG